MKKFILFFACAFAVQIADAQSLIKVSNIGDSNLADYTNLQAAVTAAVTGDSIYIYPSGVSYGNATIDKKLVIIGSGYQVETNTTTGIETYFGSSIVSDITFTNTADGSSIISVYADEIFMNGCDNITVKHCRIGRRMDVVNSNNIAILANYFSSSSYLGTTTYYCEIESCSNILIQSNLFYGYQGSSPQCTSGTDAIWVEATSSAIISQNIIRDRCNLDNCQVYNNIFLNNSTQGCSSSYNYPIYGISNLVHHNVMVQGNNYSDASNIVNADAESIFVGWSAIGINTFDSRFELAVGSPAIGAGDGGLDCGMFGGAFPYKLSGIPGIPLVYELNLPFSGTNDSGINVNVKVRTEE